MKLFMVPVGTKCSIYKGSERVANGYKTKKELVFEREALVYEDHTSGLMEFKSEDNPQVTMVVNTENVKVLC